MFLLSFVERLKHRKVKIFTDTRVLPENFRLVALRSIQSVNLSTFHVCFRMVLPWKHIGFLDRSTGRLIFCAVSLTRMIRQLTPPRTNLNRFTSYYRALSFRVLTPSLLLLVVGVFDAFVQDWSGKDNWIFLSSGSRSGRLLWAWFGIFVRHVSLIWLIF